MIENIRSLRKIWNLYNLMKSQWKSNKELKILQEKRLRSVIKYSYEEIPLFHSKCKKVGVRPEEIKTVDDLAKIPLTTKAEIQANFPHGVVARNLDLSKCWKPRTSGSTGRPLTMVYDDIAEDFEKATALRPNLTCGQKPWSKWGVITSPDHIVEEKWFQKLGLFSIDFVSLFDTAEDQIRMLRKLDVDVLDGYASSIYLIARELIRKGEDDIHPKFIFTTAEMLTEKMRDIIDSAFGLNIFDQFGCVEFGRTAWECAEHIGYHMDMESVVMEFIRDGDHVSPNESGEIVYTGLYNYAMPLIRYRIGDVGVPSDEMCPCGRGLTLMKRLEGRNDAFIRTPSGRILSPIIWTILLRPFDLLQFKVTQHRIDLIKIQVIPLKKFMSDNISNVIKRVTDVLGEDIEVIIELVGEIPRESSGKIRSVVSLI